MCRRALGGLSVECCPLLCQSFTSAGRRTGPTVRKFRWHPCAVYTRPCLFSPPSLRRSEEGLPLAPMSAFSFGNKSFSFIPARAINVRL